MFTLAACGGGAPEQPELASPEISPEALEYAYQRAQAARKANAIVNSADTLLMSSFDVHSDVLDSYTYFTCSGTNCVTPDGAVIALQDILAETETLAAADSEVTDFETRSGFYTVRYSGGMDIGDLLPRLQISGDSVESLGFWGDHGMASVGTAEATISGSLGGVQIDQLAFSMNAGSVVGDATGSNPATSATWRGIAEAYDAAGKTGSGTATLTVDLSGLPIVDAEIRIGLTQIGSSDWSNIPLSGGRFETGQGFDDHIVGDFHGPNHEEAWGTFDTTDWSGVFGAKK